MLHFARWKMIAILATCLASLVFAAPNFFAKDSLAAWPSFMPNKQLALGLDLRGGAPVGADEPVQVALPAWRVQAQLGAIRGSLLGRGKNTKQFDRHVTGGNIE